jgi:hypothetical protein
MEKCKLTILFAILLYSLTLLVIYNSSTQRFLQLNQALETLKEHIIVPFTGFFKNDEQTVFQQITNHLTSTTKALIAKQATEKRNSANEAVKKVFDNIYEKSVWGNRQSEDGG